VQSDFYIVHKMSDHSDFKQFLKMLNSMLDTVSNIVYNVRCRIRVEQEINDNVSESTSEEFSGPAESDALVPNLRQGGPETFPGSPKEKSRSQNAAETVLVRGGRMETPDGRQ